MFFRQKLNYLKPFLLQHLDSEDSSLQGVQTYFSEKRNHVIFVSVTSVEGILLEGVYMTPG